ncbi:MAG TPA: helix-turn-helix transcriptional regulator [Alphaproteobacteria bacterium]|nr:helix-turn-helix transcriptional regulator [Alphaproteobacteria bacterium]
MTATSDSATLRTERPPFGALLRKWRRSRGLSQLELALTCGISQRHLSFLESGRANPSRGMAMHLASTLAVPLTEQNALLLAAGFAPAYGERPLQAPDMRPISEALARTLRQQEPFPAVVVDRHYDLLDANRPAQRMLGFLLGLDSDGGSPGADAGVNLLGLMLSPEGLRPMVTNWEESATWLIRRLRAEALVEGTPEETEAFLKPLMKLPGVARLMNQPREPRTLPPTLVVRFARDGVELALFSMIASMGTPLDATLQAIRVEFFFPADAATEAWFRDQAAGDDA